MPKPSNEKLALVRELRMNPVWGSMLDDIDKMGGVPQYRPGSKKTPEEKKADWIFRSGMDAGIEKVLTYLGYER